jgi:hypothetical protein
VAGRADDALNALDRYARSALPRWAAVRVDWHGVSVLINPAAPVGVVPMECVSLGSDVPVGVARDRLPRIIGRASCHPNPIEPRSTRARPIVGTLDPLGLGMTPPIGLPVEQLRTLLTNPYAGFACTSGDRVAVVVDNAG